jgi:uncharacterized membrane protein
MRRSYIAVLVIIAVSFAMAIYLYPEMPEEMASHWNVKGDVDGYLPKFWGLFLMPFLLAGLFLLFVAIPKIDPLKSNIEKFRRHFDVFIVLIILFLFYIYMLTVFWALGVLFDMIQALVPAFAVLFFYVGVLVENAKRNWFIGIRTPWTLSSESVWNKTHKLGGKLFKIAAVVTLLGFFFRDFAIWFILIPVFAVAIYLVAYSYFEYGKLERNKSSTPP